MARPKLPRRKCCEPYCTCFTPKGGKPGEGVTLSPDEFDAIKLHDGDNLDQKEIAKKMKISQPTLARVLASAHKKIADALFRGSEIKITS